MRGGAPGVLLAPANSRSKPAAGARPALHCLGGRLVHDRTRRRARAEHRRARGAPWQAARVRRLAAAALLGGSPARRLGFLIEDWTEAVAGALGGALAGARRRARSSAARSGAAAREAALRSSSASSRSCSRGSRSCPSSATSPPWSCRCSPSACAAGRRSATRAAHPGEVSRKLILGRVDGLTPSMLEAVARLAGRRRGCRARRARRLRRAGLRVPVADPRSASRRSRPAPARTCTRSRTSSGTTAASGGSSSTARLRRPARRGLAPLDPRHDRQHERRAPRPRRGHGLRGARGRGARDRRRSTSPATAAARARADGADAARPGARPAPLLLLQPLRVGPDRRPARLAEPRGGTVDDYAAGGRPLARHARRLRLPRLLPSDYDFASHAHGPGRGA